MDTHRTDNAQQVERSKSCMVFYRVAQGIGSSSTQSGECFLHSEALVLVAAADYYRKPDPGLYFAGVAPKKRLQKNYLSFLREEISFSNIAKRSSKRSVLGGIRYWKT